MNPKSWREMVERSKELQESLGSNLKKVEENEKETVILQRRAIRLKYDKFYGEIIKDDDLIELRPCPEDSIPLAESYKLIGKKLNKPIKKGDYLKWQDLM